MEDQKLIRARHFRARVAECLVLADMTPASEIAERYREMAQRYEKLAEYEEDCAKH